MKGIFYSIIAIAAIIALSSAFIPETDPTVTAVAKQINGTDTNHWNNMYRQNDLYYDKAGLISQPMKHWSDTLFATGATAQTISISSAGFSVIKSCKVIATSGSAFPLWVNYTNTLTAITYSIWQPNQTTVSVLTFGSLLLGTPQTAATNTSTIIMRVEVTGY